jgi:hypothetical protein
LPLIASGNRRPYFIENQFSGLGAYKKKKKKNKKQKNFQVLEN